MLTVQLFIHVVRAEGREKRQTMNHTNVIIVASLGVAQNCYNFQRGQRPQYAFQKWGHKKYYSVYALDNVDNSGRLLDD